MLRQLDILELLNAVYFEVRAEETLEEAVRAKLRHVAQPWWLMLVQVGDGRWLACQAGDLSQFAAENRHLLHTPVSELEDVLLLPVGALDAGDVSAAEVFMLAQEHPSGIVAVTWLGGLLGAVEVGRSRSGSDIRFGSSGEAPAWPSEDENFMPEPQPAPGAVPAPAPALPPAPAKPTDSTINVDGDYIGGDQVIHGDKHQHIYMQATSRQVMPVERRFEAAFPRECELKKDCILVLAVTRPESPSALDGGHVQPAAIDAPVSLEAPLAPDGTPLPTYLQVSVSASGFDVKGSAVRYLRLWPDDERPQLMRFVLEPEETGQQQIFIELNQDKDLVGSFTLETIIHAAKPAGGAVSSALLNLSLGVMRLNVQFEFMPRAL